MRTVQQLYDDKRDKVIIDIRDKEEYDKETMDSAVQYFWEDMMNDLKMDNISGREKARFTVPSSAFSSPMG